MFTFIFMENLINYTGWPVAGKAGGNNILFQSLAGKTGNLVISIFTSKPHFE